MKIEVYVAFYVVVGALVRYGIDRVDPFNFLLRKITKILKEFDRNSQKLLRTIGYREKFNESSPNYSSGLILRSLLSLELLDY